MTSDILSSKETTVARQVIPAEPGWFVLTPYSKMGEGERPAGLAKVAVIGWYVLVREQVEKRKISGTINTIVEDDDTYLDVTPIITESRWVRGNDVALLRPDGQVEHFDWVADGESDHLIKLQESFDYLQKLKGLANVAK